jgi:hypothetical protein
MVWLTTHLHEELISKIFLVVVTGDEWLDIVPVLGMHPQERTSSEKLIKFKQIQNMEIKKNPWLKFIFG